MPAPDTRLAELRAHLKLLAEGRLAEAERTDLSTMHFSDSVKKVRVLKRLGEAFAQEKADELPPGVVDGVRALVAELPNVVQTMIEFDVEDANAGQKRRQIISWIDSNYDQMIGSWRQFIRGQVNSAAVVERIGQIEEKANALLADVENTVGRAEQMVSRADTLAAEMAAGSLSSYYDGQAAKHRSASKAFLSAAAAAGGILVVLATALFLTVDERPSSEWTAYVRDVGIRVFVLGLGLYVVGFLVKSYRANQHLLVVNEHKANALKTFRLFQDAASQDDATRGLITAELVKAVFAADETGFLDNAPDRTVVEGQSGLLALLAQKQ